jgi:hypothetical protein
LGNNEIKFAKNRLQIRKRSLGWAAFKQTLTTNQTPKMKTYEIHARFPLTQITRNAGATGRKYWWAFADKVKATSAKAACATYRKSGAFAYADKLRAVPVI